MATLPYYVSENDIYTQLMRQMPQQGQPFSFANPYGSNFTGGYNPNLYQTPLAETSASAARRVAGLLGGGSGGGGDSAQQASSWSQMSPAQQAAYYAANPTMANITQALQNAFGRTAYGRAQNAMVPGFVRDQQLIAQGIDPAAVPANTAAMQSMQNALIADQNAINAMRGYAPVVSANTLALMSGIPAAFGNADTTYEGSGLLGLSDASVGQAEADAIAAAAQSMADALGSSGENAPSVSFGGPISDYGATPSDLGSIGYDSGLLGLSDASVGQAEADAVSAAETAAAMGSMADAAAADAAAAAAASSADDGYGGYGGYGGYDGGSYGGYDSGGYDSGGYGGDSGGYGGDSGGYGGDGWAKGGKVTMSGLLTNVPTPGEDDGYGALQAGEYVIKKSTTKKLGDKKLKALNEGRATIKMRK